MPLSRWLSLLVALVLGLVHPGAAQTVSDYAIRLGATVQTNPPGILLSWPSNAYAGGFTLYRKTRAATSWGAAVAALPAGSTAYTDGNVAVGSAFEYCLSNAVGGYPIYGYIYAGIEVPMVENRGIVSLVVDGSVAAALAPELAQLTQDLVGDGWQVRRHDVPRMSVDPADTSPGRGTARSNEVAAVKALIQADYAADPVNLNTVFLLGHVPVPYSGEWAYDDHADHLGAWPADIYYGVMTGTWTDASANWTHAADPRNWNTPGDGKFDATWLTDLGSGVKVQLQVGRVDFAKLPAFALSETELLRRYLDKDHNFRHKLVTLERRGLVDDQFGILRNADGEIAEIPALNGWRNFAPLLGVTNCLAGDWLATSSAQSFLWGYGCGPGGPDFASCSGVATTTGLAAADPRVAFTLLFGSYFGDWDTTNNLLRAQIATPSFALACCWAARPNWFFHHLALGETLGFAVRLTQNNALGSNRWYLYDPGLYPQSVAVALMGDPTLRLHPVAPPASPTAVTNAAGSVVVAWAPSSDLVAGYRIYRSATVQGPFTNVGPALIPAAHYTDPTPPGGVYMVRAVNLEATPAGSYYNLSQGVFTAVGDNGGTPRLSVNATGSGTVTISGTEVLGRVYRIEYCLDAGLTNWQTLGTATDGVTSFQFIDPASSPQQFYRTVWP